MTFGFALNPGLPMWLINVAGESYGPGTNLRREYRGPRSVRDPNAVPFDLTDRVLSFSYEQAEKKQDKVTLVVANHDLSFFASPIMVKGTDFTFSFGYAGQLAPGGSAKVQSLRGFQQLRIEAYAIVLAITSVQKTRVFENRKRDEIVRQIASEHWIQRTDIASGASSFSPESGVPRTFVQSGITDWEFILELAEPLGYSVWFTVEQGVRVLHWGPRKYGAVATRVFAWNSTGISQVETVGNGAARATNVAPLLAFNVDDNSQKGKPSRVDQSGYDPDEHQPLTARGTPATEVESLDSMTEISEPGRSGGKFEEAVQLEPTAHAKVAFLTEENKARNKWTQEDQIKASATVPGDPTLAIGQLVEIQNVPNFLAGNWYVLGATHSIASDGYKTKLKLTRNAVGDTKTGTSSKVPASGKVNTSTATGRDPNQLVPIRGRDSFGERVIVYGRQGR